MEYVLGLDLGTSSLKGIVVDKAGNIVMEASSSYQILSEQVGYSEQNPQDWLVAFEFVMATLSSKIKDLQYNLKAISFSGQMHSLVLLDEKKEVLRPAILWNDTRTTKQCQQIMDSFGTELLQITKNIAVEGFTLPKILWVKENEPAIWEKVRHVLLPKDYLRWYLTGILNMEFSDASGTLLLDVDQKDWSKDILKQFNIEATVLPPLVESMTVVGNLSDTIREKFGLKEAIKVVAGGADNACSALGSGILTDDISLSSIGTSGVVLSAESHPNVTYKGDLHVFYHVIANVKYSMGVTLAAGNSLSWFKQTFAEKLTFAELMSCINEVGIGAEGLLFTPYITGERTPYIDSQIRGSFIGIDMRHTFKHFTRAVVEGITFSLKDCLKIMEHQKGRRKRIIAVGGGALNEDWLQIQADIFACQVQILQTEQGPGFGAAILAALGLGWFKDANMAVQAFVKEGKSYDPIPRHVVEYEKIYRQYQNIYSQTKPIMN
ncbi:xylulokinase [Streptococcus cuniculi]|uniref:Xylulose kinase n=1 Tax=Streptococcus cuniculi TaxID=1432788 RepID=A0A4Y9J6Y8_9STRE|nr:xylulokinase [Streptococcus cuniculi]MBF0779244.1 xylulokinase [Streptococcus cuniculi]TFU96793.1 xylulokinase [Streptococcus cuniculi]